VLGARPATGPPNKVCSSASTVGNLSKRANIVAVGKSYGPHVDLGCESLGRLAGLALSRAGDRSLGCHLHIKPVRLVAGGDRIPGKQDVPADSFEIILVDNSPDQAGAARFGQRYSGLSNLAYLVEPKPGLSNPRNKGTAAAAGSIVPFIDDDARASPSWANELLNAVFNARVGRFL
jgi:Glycosyl transferase family 2